MASQPMLTGFRVLDFTQFVAGPTCTRLLAEMGAEVIKLEMAPEGDRVRDAGLKAADPKLRNSQNTLFFQHNHSKQSLAIDLKHPRGHALVQALIPKVDVVVENYAPGAIARLGFSYPEVKKLNPSIVMCSVSATGQTGPLADTPGYDFIGGSFAGVVGQIGEPDRGPVQIPLAIGDISTGVAACLAVVSALLHRERTGEGNYIDASLLDTYFHMHDRNVPRASILKEKFSSERNGSVFSVGDVQGNFHYRDDEYVCIIVQPHQWPQLIAAMGMPELDRDPRFTDPRARRANIHGLKEIIERWLGGFPSRDAALQVLNRHRVPCAPVLTVSEAIAHPHLRERGTVRRVTDPYLGAFDIPNVPFRFSNWPARTEVKADLLGEHNERVLSDLLGVSEAEIAELYAQKVLVHDPYLDRQR